MKSQAIIDAIIAYREKNGEGQYGWYAGITNNPRRRLFSMSEHNVDEKDDVWIYRQASSEQQARDTEAALHEGGWFRGAGGGGDNPTFVYAYRITATTDENA